MPGKPAAFMSYARFNDQQDDGKLTQFCQRLSAEVQVQTGEQFPIFQDRSDIAWGQNWQKRIDETLDAVTLLLVIITPGFFRSTACRAEVERFLAREGALGRDNLILPVYYVSTPEVEDPRRRETDELARVLASRQYVDWRELRFKPFASPVVRRAIAQLATRMRDTFWHLPTAQAADQGQLEHGTALGLKKAEQVIPAHVATMPAFSSGTGRMAIREKMVTIERELSYKLRAQYGENGFQMGVRVRKGNMKYEIDAIVTGAPYHKGDVIFELKYVSTGRGAFNRIKDGLHHLADVVNEARDEGVLLVVVADEVEEEQLGRWRRAGEGGASRYSARFRVVITHYSYFIQQSPSSFAWETGLDLAV